MLVLLIIIFYLLIMFFVFSSLHLTYYQLVMSYVFWLCYFFFYQRFYLFVRSDGVSWSLSHTDIWTCWHGHHSFIKLQQLVLSLSYESCQLVKHIQCIWVLLMKNRFELFFLSFRHFTMKLKINLKFMFEFGQW